MVANYGKPYRSARRCFSALAIALLGVFAAGVFGTASAQQSITSMEKAKARRANSPFNLNSGPNAVLQANLVQCGVDNSGNVCTDIFNSPTGGGGFWPSGTTNQYIFNSGLQIAGINGNAAGPWSNDTVGAYFFDARGTQPQGTPLSDVFNSLTASDVAAWPDGARVSDTTLFNKALFDPACIAGNASACPKSVSDQDSWVQYWDGDPNRISQRAHPMGIKVEQRSMAFNAPAGAENTIFFIYKFTNVTNDPAFQQPNEAKFSVQLPDAGWTINNVYAAFSMDPDVSSNGAGNNFSTGFLPFNMGMAYHAQFTADDFNYAARSDLYAPPYFKGPGFVGVKYLRSPINPATRQEVGLTMFSNTTNGGTFPDPVGVKQLFRYLKGDVNTAAGDPPCTIPQSITRRLCALVQDPSDTRFFEASGPFSLGPGQSATIVVAYTHGPPRSTADYKVGDVLRPGIPSRTPGVAGEPIRTIEKIAGLLAVPTTAVVTDAGGNVSIDQSKLVVGRDVAPGSLVANALIAQSIFNNKFLLPRPPESPTFSLVPGANQVTVVWGPSRTDQTGDPYYSIASDVNSPLYNANYRKFDVEGYRIYRATGLSGGFELIAQFDKTGTEFVDFTGELDPSFVPEEGDPYQGPVSHALNGDIVQFETGGRIRDAVTGSVIVTHSQTVSLQDTGVPFAFVDRSVRNGITYRYIVTAFDVNSLRSGATSLESARQPQVTVPRNDPTNITFASFKSSVTGGGKALDLDAPLPTIDGATGQFSGPMPPANGLATSFQPLAERLMPAFKLVATVDSIIAYTEDTHPSGNGCPKGSNALGACWRMFMTFDRDGTKSTSIAEGFTPIWAFGFGEPVDLKFQMGAGAIPADTAAARQFKLTSSFPGFSGTVEGTFPETFIYSSMEGQTNRRAIAGQEIYPGFGTGPRHVAGGSRWFSGANESTPDPTRLIRVGHLTGVDTVWAPIHHTPTVAGDLSGVAGGGQSTSQFPASSQMQCFSYYFSEMGRAADVRFTWGANGAVTVLDVSNNTPEIFKPNVQASYGFLNTDANGNGVIDWADFNYISNVSPAVTDGNVGGLGCGHQHNPAKVVNLEATPKIMPVSTAGTTAATAKTATGQGFGLYINGERYIFQMTGGTLPASGQTWTLRTYTGILRASSADAGVSADPSGYTFRGDVEPRQPMVTGITVTFESPKATALEGEFDLKRIHTVPDPYYVRSAFELGPSNKVLRFVNLPPQAIVRIFSLNGTLVRVLAHNDPQGGSELAWDLRNRNNQFVASGVYFYSVEAPNGETKTGRFTVVQFAR